MRDRFTRVLKGHIALALARFPLPLSLAPHQHCQRHPLRVARQRRGKQ